MKKINYARIMLFLGIAAVLGVLSTIYFIIAIIVQKQFPQYSVGELFFIYASGNNIDVLFDSVSMYVLLALSRIFEAITIAIFSSFAFALILNKGIKLTFPDKIVISRRNSEGSDGALCIGILVGNPKKYTLFDVECWVNCSYIKEKGEVNKKNSEVILVQSIKKMNNYYRFTFNITEFHKKFWQDYLERDMTCMNEDYISVIISGRANTLGGTFTIEKKYMLSDIGIDLRNPEDYFKGNITKGLTGKKEMHIDGSKFTQFIEAGEEEREDVINEIRQYAKS